MRIKVHQTEETPYGFTTVGYWMFDQPNNRGGLHIFVCKLPQRRFHWAVVGHEFLEAMYCWLMGIAAETCDSWDSYFEREYEAGRIPRTKEAGDDRQCPYFIGHQLGILWEYLCIYGTFSSWTAYGDACNSVMGIESVPATCEHCPHRDYDETPDGENMWSWCKHPSVPTGDPYYGRMSLDDEHGRGKPPPYCPLRIPPRPLA